MHLTRQQTSTQIPIKRKGSKYVARASSHFNNSISVLLATRDVLGIAKNAREVKAMIVQKLLFINHRPVRDMHESIRLFNHFTADKNYILSILKTGKFTLLPAEGDRIAKVISKKLVKGGKIQVNLHDGSNFLSTKEISTGDSVVIDKNGKMKSHKKLEKGVKAFIISGRYKGCEVSVKDVKENEISVKLNNGEARVPKSNIIVT